MKKLITLIFILFAFNLNSQVIDNSDKLENKIVREYKFKKFFKNLYDDIFKYATIYVAGDMKNAYETQYPDYFIRTNPDDLYAIPRVEDQTVYHPFDYRAGFGIRKLARFDYEIKGNNYYDGTENNKALSAPTAAVKGFEYLFHWEKERQRSDVFTNSRYFLRHTGDYHIVKIEQREVGNVDLKYQSAEVRARLPIGKKFSISAGVIARTHQKAFGYNPIELWLNEVDEDGNPANYWYTLGFEYGYDDWYYASNDENGNSFYDWYWTNPQGDIVAWTDRQFRDLIFGQLMNDFNQQRWAELDPFAEYAPIVGFDFYHYSQGGKFWLHSYANWILPYHKYFKGNVDFSYLHRDSWGLGGHNNLLKGKQWSDYQGGLIIGWKISKTLGIFVEGEYAKFWDSEIYNSSVGLNFRL